MLCKLGAALGSSLGLTGGKQAVRGIETYIPQAWCSRGSGLDDWACLMIS